MSAHRQHFADLNTGPASATARPELRPLPDLAAVHLAWREGWWHGFAVAAVTGLACTLVILLVR